MTILIEKFIGDKLFIDGFCKHDETKPTDGIAMGSRLLEADTGDIYRFVNETAGWNLSDEGGSGGGGGSGLPEPTAADVGKVATVEEIPVISSVIVPEQTVTTEYDEASGNYRAVLNNIDASAFALGMFVTMSVNGVTEPGLVYLYFGNGDEPSGLACELYDLATGIAYRFIKTENNTMLFDCYAEGGPYTVSVVEPTLIDTSTAVPEQTVTTEVDEDESTSAVLSNVDASKFVPGTPVVITINSIVFNTIAYEAYDGVIECDLYDSEMGEITCQYFVSESKMMLYAAAGTYTVSLVTKAPQHSYEWRPAEPSGSVLVVHTDSGTGALDKTWQEIYDAFMSGVNCIIEVAEQGTNELVIAVNSVVGNPYEVVSVRSQFTTNSANDYPAP